MLLFFWFDHFLDAKEEIDKCFWSFFGGIEDIKSNLLKFPDLSLFQIWWLQEVNVQVCHFLEIFSNLHKHLNTFYPYRGFEVLALNFGRLFAYLISASHLRNWLFSEYFGHFYYYFDHFDIFFFLQLSDIGTSQVSHSLPNTKSYLQNYK